ncbi:MAG: DNA recombination protein RmuC [Actinobacteria bacterium]|nr:DNA recombination protein RmuC [Actinomycetota bacterium]
MSGDALALVALAVLVVLAVAAVARRQEAALGRMAERLRDDREAQREAGLRVAVEHLVDVAGQRLETHTAAGARELEAQRGAISQQLGTMGAELERVARLVSDLQTDRARTHGELTTQIRAAGEQTARLADTTGELREALASSRTRGQWGERMAEDVLRLAGFVENVNYRRQKAVDGGGIPDFTFMLPRDLLLHMDVKFPLDNYVRYLGAGSDRDRDAHRLGFLRDVRQRVRELAAREYGQAEGTVDCVLLFIPNEQVYGFIHQHDDQLLDTAMRAKVVFCSPLTLFAVLAVIRQSVDNFVLERTSREILSVLGGFSTQWRKFTDQLDTVGTHMERAQRAYETLTGTRRRQLQRSLDRVEELRRERGLAEGDEEVVKLAR